MDGEHPKQPPCPLWLKLSFLCCLPPSYVFVVPYCTVMASRRMLIPTTRRIILTLPQRKGFSFLSPSAIPLFVQKLVLDFSQMCFFLFIIRCNFSVLLACWETLCSFPHFPFLSLTVCQSKYFQPISLGILIFRFAMTEDWNQSSERAYSLRVLASGAAFCVPQLKGTSLGNGDLISFLPLQKLCYLESLSSAQLPLSTS